MLNIISRISFVVLPCYKQKDISIYTAFCWCECDFFFYSDPLCSRYAMGFIVLAPLSLSPQWCILVLSCNYTLHTGKVGVLNTTRPECLPDDQFVVEWKICFLPSTFVSTYHLSQAKCWEKSVVLVNTVIQITFSKHVTV